MGPTPREGAKAAPGRGYGEGFLVVDDTPADQYFRILLKGGVPVGAVLAGSQELAATLGLLQPLIAAKIHVGSPPGKLKSVTAQYLAEHHPAFHPRGGKAL